MMKSLSSKNSKTEQYEGTKKHSYKDKAYSD